MKRLGAWLGWIVALGTIVVFASATTYVIKCPSNVRWPTFLSAPSQVYWQAEISGDQKPIETQHVTEMLASAESILFIVGYGAIVAQAQTALVELANTLSRAGKDINFGVNACEMRGRTWAHIQLLNRPLAPVLGFDEVNKIVSSVDVVFVLGGNDIVNPISKEANSPLSGLPVFSVWEAKNVIVSKRGQGTGYSGISNPLFFLPNTRMLYGDGQAVVEEILHDISGILGE